MRRNRPGMGVEGPSFHEYQKQKGEQPQTPPPKKKGSLFFGPPVESEPAAPATPPPPAETRESRVRPGFQPSHSSPWEDPETWFEVQKIWKYVEHMRSTYHIRVFPVPAPAPPPVPITRLTMSAVDPRYDVVDMNVAVAQIAQFFGLPVSSFQGLTLQDAWIHVFDPFLNALARAMNNAKPFMIPGYLKFEMDENGSLIIVYQER